MTDHIKIILRDCRVDLRVGHFASEMEQTQPVLITVECEARLQRRYDDISNNDLSQVINYRPIHEFITSELTQMGHIYLLESAAELIITFCLRDPRIERIRVRIEKIAVFADGTFGGIDMERSRS